MNRVTVCLGDERRARSEAREKDVAAARASERAEAAQVAHELLEARLEEGALVRILANGVGVGVVWPSAGRAAATATRERRTLGDGHMLLEHGRHDRLGVGVGQRRRRRKRRSERGERRLEVRQHSQKGLPTEVLAQRRLPETPNHAPGLRHVGRRLDGVLVEGRSPARGGAHPNLSVETQGREAECKGAPRC